MHLSQEKKPVIRKKNNSVKLNKEDVIRMNGKEELITCCGLYCGDCFMYHDKVASLAGELDKELKDANFKKYADVFAQYPFSEVFKKYDDFVEILETLKGIKCVGCRKRESQPICKIRTCCEEKKITGCWECEEFHTCNKLDFLQETHGDAVLKNLDILKEKGVDAFLGGERYWNVE